jgi:Holliday junction resolvasome RuvABC DNA-binding subunit
VVPTTTGGGSVVLFAERTATTDVREALVGLGYSPDEIRAATAELADDGDASAMLRQALQRLASAR